MATWPESSPAPTYPLTITSRSLTVVTPLGGALEQTRAEWVYPKFDIEVPYYAITASEAHTLFQFHIARRGRYESFYIYDLALLADIYPAHVDAYIGVADGSTTIFDLPGRTTSARTVYVDGAAQSSGISYLAGGGESSADRVEFAAAPSAGAVIKCNFTGARRYNVRFESDSFSKELFEVNLFRTGVIKLKGAAPV